VPVRGVFGEEAGAASILAAGRKALQTAQQQQDHRCQHADRVVAGDQTDGQRRGRHHQDHDRQHPLTADPVTERAEEESTERTHEERGSEDRESAQQRGRLVAGGKEFVGDVGGEEAVHREVEPFDGVADRGAAHRLPDGFRFGAGVTRGFLLDAHGCAPG
jgi:hypothetical protein